MKKLFPFFLATIIGQSLVSQTITATQNVPSPGDVYHYKLYDSIASLPQNTGMGQQWDFSNLQLDEDYGNEQFVLPSSIPQSSLFPTATVVEVDTSGGSTSYDFMRLTNQTPAQLETLGYMDSQETIPFLYSDNMVLYQYPMSYGSTFHDFYEGAQSGPNFYDNTSGTRTVTASGTGTLTVPGGLAFYNILQIKTVSNEIEYLTGATDTIKTHSIRYDYFDPDKHSPLLSLYIESETQIDPQTSTPVTDTDYEIVVNTSLATGIRDLNFDALYVIYPNPARDNFSVKLSNQNNDRGRIEIYNSIGILEKTIDLGKSTKIDQTISMQGLSAGVYLVRTSLGTRHSSRRLIIE